MGGKTSRRKGHQFERDVANALKRIFPNARRQLEYHEDDARGVDVQGVGEYRIQCKKRALYAPVTAINEVQCDRVMGDVPVLVTAGDGQEAVAILYFNDFLRLVDFYEKNRK